MKLNNFFPRERTYQTSTTYTYGFYSGLTRSCKVMEKESSAHGSILMSGYSWFSSLARITDTPKDRSVTSQFYEREFLFVGTESN